MNAADSGFEKEIIMFHQQVYLTTGDDGMMLDDATPVTFGENKKSNCKVVKQDLPATSSNGMIE